VAAYLSAEAEDLHLLLLPDTVGPVHGLQIRLGVPENAQPQGEAQGGRMRYSTAGWLPASSLQG